MMRAGAVLLLLSLTVARAQDVVVRTSLDPSGPVVLGQPVALLIDVLFAGEMAHPPRIVEPHVAGAQVLNFQSQGMNIRDRVGETNYMGQRFELDIYPRRAGTLTVPPIQVTLLDKTGNPIGTRQGAGLRIDARVPYGLDPSGPIIASAAVTMREVWEPAKPKTFHPGDALVRRVTRTAATVPGLAMANLRLDAPEGVRAYVDPPQINDLVEHGEVTGTRIDRVTYVFERGGDVMLPAVSQPWWNLRSATAQTLTLPARRLTVLATPVAPLPRRMPVVAIVALASAAIALLLLFGLRRRIAERWAAWLRSPRHLERAAFRALRQRCRSTDPVATYQAWQTWTAAQVTVGLKDDAVLRASVHYLESCIFGHHGAWTAADARQLEIAAATVRKRGGRLSPVSALPSLNG